MVRIVGNSAKSERKGRTTAISSFSSVSFGEMELSRHKYTAGGW